MMDYFYRLVATAFRAELKIISVIFSRGVMSPTLNQPASAQKKKHFGTTLALPSALLTVLLMSLNKLLKYDYNNVFFILLQEWEFSVLPGMMTTSIAVIMLAK